VSGGQQGLSVRDMEAALSQSLNKLGSTLTVRNVHAFLSDLPQDVDVVAVEPIVKKVSRPYVYLDPSAAQEAVKER
jgi:hypothetical protein